MKKQWHAKLAAEIMAAYKEEGAALRKKKILIEWQKQIKHFSSL